MQSIILRTTLVSMFIASLLAASCIQEQGGDGAKTSLVIYAASSLTETFRSIENAFEEANPEMDVSMTFAGSQVLRFQIEQGAQVDIFASANQDHTEALISGGHMSGSQFFASNELVVIVPTANPADIQHFRDLEKASLIVTGSNNVPVGIYTLQVLERARQHLGEDFVAAVQTQTVSLENNVRLVRAKVEMGEADAAIVYRTEASSHKLKVVAIPEKLNAQVRYHIGALTRSAHAPQAVQFINYVLSADGRQLLHSHGFLVSE